MFTWRQILQPSPITVSSDATIQDVLRIFVENSMDIAIVADEGEVKGYIHSSFFLQQIYTNSTLQQTIDYRQDLLIVNLDGAVEFYHNISIYIGVDTDGKLVGYSTTEQAHNRIHELRLTQMNQLLDGAGVGMITTNSALEITFINGVAEKILGLSDTLLLQRNYKSLLHISQNLDDVLAGKPFVSVDSYLNFKHMIGNFTPLYVNGNIEGLVHIFFLREQWEEAVQELEFVRQLNEDLQAIYSSSHEQIMVVNPKGEVIRVAGTFLKEYWDLENDEEMIGRNVKELEEQGLFQPNIVDLCLKQQKKITGIQETKQGRRVWSVATPVFYDEQITRVIIVSRDITEVNQLREKLVKEQMKSEEYKQKLEELKSHQVREKELIYRSQEMERVVEEIRRVALVDSSVLIHGESGVGKDVIAYAIHDWGNRRLHPFIRVNCGAIPEPLMESELFGYEKGAFTGADDKGKAGFFELAHQGTIFLDEIGELPLSMQVKLLRVLQEQEFTRVGGTKMIKVDFRVIAATNKNLWELVQENRFREDLYYRLHVIPIHIPPLRKRKADIFSLSLHFLQQFNRKYLKKKNLSREALEVLENYHWNGNVRELQNVIERLLVTSRTDFINRDEVLHILYAETETKMDQPFKLELMPLKKAIAKLETQLITLGLQKYGTAAKVSEILEVSPATISRRMKKLLN
ncbi:sigma 54-interacting transcriptional regulator [Aneurinibacillus terranovensis]|uniref:sigma 54-interacting transcriptional regulator n=1 Tax=Aneurinibacillus terranovensis TaxID=278991 RepID=UPI0004023CF7|nr:sigma 54-interacting transcriptional regulator [Aneurinibacillus terranovensis]